MDVCAFRVFVRDRVIPSKMLPGRTRLPPFNDEGMKASGTDEKPRNFRVKNWSELHVSFFTFYR